MEKTLNLPDALADRLRGREDQLGQILELGLQAVEREDEDLEPDVDDELPAAWRAELATVMSRRRQSSEEPPPSLEELIAYHRGELEPAEEEKWLERLALHPESVRDLADLIDFDRDEIPTAQQAQETAEALRLFRARARRSASPPSRRLRWIALAAVLVIAVGASWISWLLGHQEPASGPRYATVIDVATSRGARPFPVSEDAQEILLILPVDMTAEPRQGTLQITADDGDLVYQDTFQVTGDRWSRLYVSLPRDHFPPGSYRIEITTSGQNDAPDTQEFRLAIEAPAPP